MRISAGIVVTFALMLSFAQACSASGPSIFINDQPGSLFSIIKGIRSLVDASRPIERFSLDSKQLGHLFSCKDIKVAKDSRGFVSATLYNFDVSRLDDNDSLALRDAELRIWLIGEPSPSELIINITLRSDRNSLHIQDIADIFDVIFKKNDTLRAPTGQVFLHQTSDDGNAEFNAALIKTGGTAWLKATTFGDGSIFVLRVEEKGS